MDSKYDQDLTTAGAFETAVLETERLRILGVIFVVCTFSVTGAVRILLFGSHMSHVGLYCAAALLLYECAVYGAVQNNIRSMTDVPQWFWTVNVIVEMSMPSIGVAFLASDRFDPGYRSLATSWALLFFPLLVLSTLRLSSLVSMAAGAAGTIGYLLAAVHNGWHIKTDLLSNPVTHSAVPVFAIMIFATGVIAALVARELRKHLQAALREVETANELKRVAHDLSIARSIQQSLLPKVRPQIDGYEIAGWNRSADATGGDYFDWEQFDDGSVVVTLADVTGHGIGPALLASVCRAYSRANFSRMDSLPATLQRINKSFREDLSPGRFATFVAAICRPGDDRLELLSAGHAPLFWYSHSGRELHTFSAHDVPLGILPQLTSESAQIVSMQQDDIVYLITDGFLEWENANGEDFGKSRFEQVVRSTSHLSPEEIIAELYTAVLEFAGGTSQKDDLTAVVIKRTASKPAESIPIAQQNLATGVAVA